MAEMMAAGFAFAFAGKIVNELFPSNRSTAVRDEMRRNKMAVEQYNQAKYKWEHRIRSQIEKDRQMD